MISGDDGVEIALDILEEVVGKAAAIVYDHYLDREIFPYSVKEAKKAILKNIAVSDG